MRVVGSVNERWRLSKSNEKTVARPRFDMFEFAKDTLKHKPQMTTTEVRKNTARGFQEISPGFIGKDWGKVCSDK